MSVSERLATLGAMQSVPSADETPSATASPGVKPPREDERETRRLIRAASARHLAIVHAMDLDQA